MMRNDLPELDNLYANVCSWDYYRDLIDENVVVNKLEEDNTYEEIKQASIDNLNKANSKLLEESKTADKLDSKALEPISIKFSSSEEYIKTWTNLFFYECKAQLSRAKTSEQDRPEKFTLTNMRYEEKKQHIILEFIRSASSNISYTTNDLVFLHKENIDKEDQKEHILAVAERFASSSFLQVRLYSFKSEMSFIQKLTKNTEYYITRICNMATISREYQALQGIESLKLCDLILHPSDLYDLISNKNQQEFFHIPKKLDSKLRVFFNGSQYEALKNSIKKRGVTLIQGPPGTGKSTTILGILSVILNSTLKNNEIHERKNSVVNLLDRERKYDDLDNYDEAEKVQNLVQSHPWIFSNTDLDQSSKIHDFDEVNFTIDEIFSYIEYPDSRKTDNYKLLSKPVEDGVVPPEKILVCAPSNVAIDEIIRKMISQGLLDWEGNVSNPKFVRIGTNYHPSLKEFSLDYLVNQRLGVSDSSQTLMASNIKEYDKLKREIIDNAKIVCSTLSMAGSNLVTSLNMKFDTVVIDEAAQAVEISTLIPLKFNCERLILVGDPKQLAATVFSRTALKYNYDLSLFKRFQESGYEVVVLKIQYRMHRIISKFISDTFYNGLLQDDKCISSTTEIEECLKYPEFQPLTFYDIESNEEFSNSSYYNEGQVNVIIELVKRLKIIYGDDIKKLIEKVAIISPYSIQIFRIKDAISRMEGFSSENCIDINTVDGFQGKEKEIVIFSTVRSKGSKTIGFLSDERRMNVGLSRAKSCLIVIGDSKKLIQDTNWEKLVKYSFRSATFYKIKGKVHEYFKDFEHNYQDYLVNTDEGFVKMVYTSK